MLAFRELAYKNVCFAAETEESGQNLDGQRTAIVFVQRLEEGRNHRAKRFAFLAVGREMKRGIIRVFEVRMSEVWNVWKQYVMQQFESKGDDQDVCEVGVIRRCLLSL